MIRKARPIKQPEPTMPSETQLWEAWIERRIKATEKALVGGVADVLAEERKQAQTALGELRRENERLVAKVTTLSDQLDKIEHERTARQPLKAISG